MGCYLQWTVHSALLAGLEDRFVIRKSYVIPQSVIVIQHVLISIIPLPGAYVYMYRECVALVATSLLPDVDAARKFLCDKVPRLSWFRASASSTELRRQQRETPSRYLIA